MQQNSLPGAIVGIWQDGKAPYVRAFGVRDTASRLPMATNLYMRIGSTTKSFTVTAILQLVEQHKIGLDDPIDAYVPGVPDGTAITIRELAEMRSGLSDYVTDISPTVLADPARQWSPQQVLATSFSHPLLFAPGTQFNYSNANTVLLGQVVEKATGQSLGTYLNQHIFGPEHLTHTISPTGAAFPSPHAQGYTPTPEGTTVNATDWNPSWGGAAGAMISTLDDLHTWVPDVATGKLLTPATQRQRLQFLPAGSQGVAEYGLGLEDANGWIGHSGTIAGYQSQPYYLPSQRTTMVVLLNSGNAEGMVALSKAITKIISPEHLWPPPPETGVSPPPETGD
jgi:D-alanyl-D-alanine carboxypeptidase